MDELKTIFGDGALTWEQLAEKLGGTDKKTLNLVNLAKGGYVDRGKFDAKATELAAANQTIKDLQDAAKKWDGVDVDRLRSDFAALQEKYDTDMAAARLDSALNTALAKAHARDPRLVRVLLDTGALRVSDGAVLGLEEQLKAIAQTHGYLFGEPEQAPGGARVSSGAHHAPPGGKPDFSRMTDAEYFAYIDGRA